MPFSKKTLIRRIISANAFIAILLLTSCAVKPKYEMDEQTRAHPATNVFLKYTKAVKRAENFEALVAFFSSKDQQQIEKALGWQYFAFSSSYTALKNGNCESITLKRLTKTRAHIDCIGNYQFPTLFIEGSDERMHLRVNLLKENDQWFISRSGFQHTQNNQRSKVLVRKGITFKTEI